VWQALHAGSVPVYFGAAGISEWLPNPASVIQGPILQNFTNLRFGRKILSAKF
jgi:hypothetical protein